MTGQNLRVDGGIHRLSDRDGSEQAYTAALRDAPLRLAHTCRPRSNRPGCTGFLAGRENGTGKTTVTTSIGVSPAQLEEAKASEVRSGRVGASDVVKVFPPQSLTDGDVAKEKNGSPARAFLEWWLAYQWHDVQGVLSLTEPGDAQDRRRRKPVPARRDQTLPGVEILGVSEGGRHGDRQRGTPPVRAASTGGATTGQAHELAARLVPDRRGNGQWLFAQTEFLQLKLSQPSAVTRWPTTSPVRTSGGQAIATLPSMSFVAPGTGERNGPLPAIASDTRPASGHQHGPDQRGAPSMRARRRAHGSRRARSGQGPPWRRNRRPESLRPAGAGVSGIRCEVLAPQRESWVHPATKLRCAIDYLRYFEPEFAKADDLRARARGRAPWYMRILGALGVFRLRL